MNKATHSFTDGEFLTLPNACKITNLGSSTVRRLAGECGAAVKIGRSYRIDKKKLLDYIRTFAVGGISDE